MTTNLAARDRRDPAERQLDCDGDDTDDHDTAAVVGRQVPENNRENDTTGPMLAKAQAKKKKFTDPKFPMAPVNPETMPLA